MSLKASGLCFGYSDDALVLNELNVSIPEGKITALIGRNGCGKSTLLKLFNRLLTPRTGSVTLDEKSLRDYGGRELAQKMAHLTQSPAAPDGLTVKELVEFGRHPYRGFLGRSSTNDREIVERALTDTSLHDLADRPVQALSGGQRQRAWIAMALAQDTEYLLLDEPTTYLDIAHQLEILELLSKLNSEEQKTMVMVVHDPNHASQYADHVICLASGKVLRQGKPKEIFTESNVRELFGVKPIIFDGANPERPWCVPNSTL